MASDKPRVDLSTSIVVAGVWRNLAVAEWRAQGRTVDVAAIYDLQRALIRKHAGKIVTLTIVPGAVIRPPDPAMRKAIDDAVFDIHPHTAAAAMILPAGGFGGAIVRSILTSLNFLRRLDFPNKIFAAAPDACSFLAPFVDGAPTGAAIDAAVRDILAAPPQDPAR